MKLKREIRISSLNIDEDNNIVHFRIEITNGITSGYLDFWGRSDNFKEFASALLSFPKKIDDKVKYESGEISDRCDHYLLLDVYCYQDNGYSVIHVILNNNAEQPYLNKSEFYIRTVPSSLNKLGELLTDWNPLSEKEVLWLVED